VDRHFDLIAIGAGSGGLSWPNAPPATAPPGLIDQGLGGSMAELTVVPKKVLWFVRP